MVVGLGIDIASVERMSRALERFGDRFWERILTPEERRELADRRADRATALAGRFAAKEAFSKAVGAPKDVWFQDVAIRRSASGAPEIVATGPALPYLERLKVRRMLVSISHDAGAAAAVVVLESEGLP
jgi:holo-[acyl-carrier protein] synthase